METQTLPRPEIPTVLEGTVIEATQAEAHRPEAQDFASAPPVEAQQPEPAVLGAREVKERLTPLKGATLGSRGNYTITSARTRGEIRLERVKNNFAVRAVARGVKYIADKKRERDRFRF
jgi:hypothetical protein